VEKGLSAAEMGLFVRFASSETLLLREATGTKSPFWVGR